MNPPPNQSRAASDARTAGRSSRKRNRCAIPKRSGLNKTAGGENRPKRLRAADRKAGGPGLKIGAHAPVSPTDSTTLRYGMDALIGPSVYETPIGVQECNCSDCSAPRTPFAEDVSSYMLNSAVSQLGCRCTATNAGAPLVPDNPLRSARAKPVAWPGEIERLVGCDIADRWMGRDILVIPELVCWRAPTVIGVV